MAKRCFYIITLLALVLSLQAFSNTLAQQEGNNTNAPPLAPPPIADVQAQDPIKDFIGKFIALIDKEVKRIGLQLLVSKDYKTTEVDGKYEVIFDQFELAGQKNENEKLVLSPLKMIISEGSPGILNVEISVPQELFIMHKEKKEAVIKVDGQEIKGQWSKELDVFTEFKLLANKLRLDDTEQKVNITVTPFNYDYALKDEAGSNKWTEVTKSKIGQFELNVIDDPESKSPKKAKIFLSNASIGTVIKGKDKKTFLKARRDFSNAIELLDKNTDESIKKALSCLDILRSILDLTTGDISVEKLKVYAPGDVDFETSNIVLTNSYKSDWSKDKIYGSWSFNIGSTKYVEPEEKMANVKEFEFDQIKFLSKNTLKQLPQGYFSSLSDKIIHLRSIKNSRKFKDELGVLVLTVVKDILTNSEKGGFEARLNNLAVKDKANKNYNLSSLWISTGSDSTKKTGDTLRLNLGFSGLSIPEFQKYFTALNVHMIFMDLPHLNELLDDKAINTLKTNPSLFTNELTKKIMKRLETVPVKVGAMMALMGIPETSTNLDLNLISDLKSIYKATGYVDIKVKNPDNLVAIVKELTKDPKPVQFLVALLAMGDRTMVDGKPVQTLKINITKDGKLLLNNQDISALFGGKPSATGPKNNQGQQAPQTPGK